MGCSDEHPMGQRPEDRRRADARIDQAIDELTPMVGTKGACETVGGCPVVRRTSVVASVSSFWHQAVTRRSRRSGSSMVAASSAAAGCESWR